jgi:hypothetical protein
VLRLCGAVAPTKIKIELEAVRLAERAATGYKGTMDIPVLDKKKKTWV